MLPPVLEIYAVWHPDDGPEGGREIAREFVNHFHGTLFSGLIGGAVEIYVRSEVWKIRGAHLARSHSLDPRRPMGWRRPRSPLSFPLWASAWLVLSNRAAVALGTTTWRQSFPHIGRCPTGSASSLPCWKEAIFPARR